MKSFKHIIFLLLIPLLASCSDFLQEQSQNETRPDNVQDMEKLLESSAYILETSLNQSKIFALSQIFTDDMQSNGMYNENARDIQENYSWMFQWSPGMFNEQGGAGNDPSLWLSSYELINGCNLIIQYTNSVLGDETIKQHLIGEAHALRAFYYMNMVNLFGFSYNYEDPFVNLGVPLKLDMYISDNKLKRNTVAEVYGQIESDFRKGIEIMEHNPHHKNDRRLGVLAAKGLLSRMFLYKEECDSVIKYTSEVIAEKPDLLDLSQFASKWPWGSIRYEWGNGGLYSDATPIERLWYQNITYVFPPSPTIPIIPYSASMELLNLYKPQSEKVRDIRVIKDDRADIYIKTLMHYQTGTIYPGFFSKGFSSGFFRDGVRVSEMYLNRAEAYIMKYMKSGEESFRKSALADLNHLRRYRFYATDDASVYQDEDISDKNELLLFCREERRRELCGESNHRWFDLKRYGMPELTHVYYLEFGKVNAEYKLKKNDPRYALPIPESAQQLNPNLKPN